MHQGNNDEGSPSGKGATLVEFQFKNDDGLTVDQWENLPLLERMFTDRPGWIGGAVDFGPGKGAKHLLSAAKAGTNIITRSQSVLGHIFRNALGHVNPSTVTSQGRYIKLFEKVANNSANLNPNVLTNFQRTAGGFQGFSQTFRNGKQIWTHTLNGKIINAGVNIIPK